MDHFFKLEKKSFADASVKHRFSFSGIVKTLCTVSALSLFFISPTWCSSFFSKNCGQKNYTYRADTGIVSEGNNFIKKKYRVGLIFASSITSSTPTTGFLYKVFSLTQAMREKGHQYIFYICNSSFKTKEDLDCLKIKGVKAYIIDESLFYNNKYMASLVKKDNVDVLQYEDPQTFLALGAPIKTITDIPSVLVCHDIEDELMNDLGKYETKPLLDYLHYIATHLADSVMTLTEIDKKRRVSRHGIPEDKIFVTPIGVDETLPFKGPNLERKVIGFVGNLFYEPNKRAVDYLINKVFPFVKMVHPNAEIKIIGKTPKELAFRYRDQKDVFFTGEIKDQERYLDEMSTFTVGTCCIDVGCGMNVKVANYCGIGIPVVLTPIGRKGYEKIDSIQEVPLCPQEIAKRINAILGNSDYAQKLGKESHRQIFKNLSWRNIAINLENALHYAYKTKSDKNKIVPIYPIWMDEKRHETHTLKGIHVIEAGN